ncbi:MAG: hypothetical protein Q7S79_00405 [bacterium]|nr:hypothetical protein [bacterium]
MKKLYNKIRDHEMPVGLKLILGFYVYSVTVNVWRFFMEPSIIFLGKHYEGTVASWISLIFLLYEIAWVIAMIKRLKWGWKLFISWTLLSILLGLPNLIDVISLSGKMQLVVAGLYVVVVTISVIACSYVYHKRYYFSK